MIILIDPSLIWFKPYKNNKFKYLQDVVDFIEKLFDINHIASNLYLLFLKKLMNDPFDNYREMDSVKNQIVSKLFKMLDFNNIINLDNYVYDKSVLPEGYELTYQNDVNVYYFKIINYIINNNINCLLFLSLNNHNYSNNIGETIHLVKHIYDEVDSYIAKLVSDGEFIKEGSIKSPSIDNPLPNDWLVKDYPDIRQKLLDSVGIYKPVFLLLGKEVALRNGYVFDEYLTRINNNAIREIFKSKTKPTIYLSTDIEHGAIEVFNDKPEHQGECNYVGSIRKGTKDPVHHKIILHK